MYVDDAMLYEQPTGHVIRTASWAQSLPSSSVRYSLRSILWRRRPAKLTPWKFALTDEDTAKLQRFAQHVGQTLGLECEWSWHDQVDIARKATAKANAWRSGSRRRACRCRMLSPSATTITLSMLEAAGTGVAMGNAVEEVKARANVVIGERNHQHRRLHLSPPAVIRRLSTRFLSAHTAAGPGSPQLIASPGADARPQGTAAYLQPDLNLPMTFNTLHDLRG